MQVYVEEGHRQRRSVEGRGATASQKRVFQRHVLSMDREDHQDREPNRGEVLDSPVSGLQCIMAVGTAALTWLIALVLARRNRMN